MSALDPAGVAPRERAAMGCAMGLNNGPEQGRKTCLRTGRVARFSRTGAAAAIGAEPADALRRPGTGRVGQDHGRDGGRLALRHLLPRPRRRLHRRHRAWRSSSVAIPHDNIRQQFVLDALSGAGGFDVYIADQVWLPEFYQKGFIRDSQRAGDATPTRATSRRPRIETVTYDGALVALPIMVHNCAMYYRTDLFEKAGLSGPPANWDEYPRLRPQDHRRAAASGARWSPPSRASRPRRGSTRSTSRPAAICSTPTASPTINSDAGRAALEFMTALVFDDKSAPEGVLELPDMQGRGSRASSRMAPVWPYLYSLSKEPLGGKFAIATSPGLTQPGRHRLLVGLRGRERVEEPGRRRRVHQVGDHHRPALRLRQGVAEPGAARLRHRPDLRRRRASATRTRRPSRPSPPRPPPARA